MFISTLRWRDSFGVDAAMKEAFPDEVFWKLGKIHGRDKEGHPVMYVFSTECSGWPFNGYMDLTP